MIQKSDKVICVSGDLMRFGHTRRTTNIYFAISEEFDLVATPELKRHALKSTYTQELDKQHFDTNGELLFDASKYRDLFSR